MNKLFSVAIATYNGEKYLKEQLDSIYSQSYKNFEIVVIDDCSTDNTTVILESYSKNYGLKYFVNEKNIGVTKNFEKAISLCVGEYLLLADQDDIWMPEKIITLLQNIGDSSLIYSNAEIIDEFGNKKGVSVEEELPLFGLDSSDKNFYEYLIINSFILGCTMMIDSRLLKDVLPFFESSRNHDWWISYCAYKCNGITYIDNKLSSYRHHDNNYSRDAVKINLPQKITQFLSEESKYKRKNRVITQNIIIDFLLSKDNHLDKEKRYLIDIKNLCQSYLNTTIHFNSFFKSIKYRKYFFFDQNYIGRALHIVSRLIG